MKSEWLKVALKQKGICKCGYDAVISNLGQIYMADFQSRQQITWICGGCGSWIHTDAIVVKGGLTNSKGLLPVDLFEVYLQ